MVLEKWVTIPAIAKHLGLSETTVIRMIRDKKIPAHKIGNSWRFKVSEVDEFFLKR